MNFPTDTIRVTRLQILRIGVGVVFALSMIACSGLRENVTSSDLASRALKSIELVEEDGSVIQPDYLLKAGDTLVIHLSGIPFGGNFKETVDATGVMSLPSIGRVQLSGRSSDQIRDDILSRYKPKDYFIEVAVFGPAESYYDVEGYVDEPGRFQLHRKTSAMQAITEAGGFTEFSRPTFRIKRGGYVYTLDRLAAESDPSLDFELMPGDVITVPSQGW